MVLLPEARLDEVLREQNPWWATGALPHRARHTQERDADARLADAGSEGARGDGGGRAVLLVGPRRSGKTSALLRRVDRHLRAGLRPRDVAYLPLDHPVLRLGPPGTVVDRALRLMACEGEPQILLDGIQALPSWPERLMEVIRTRPQARFVAASTVSPGVDDPDLELVELSTLSFREFCSMRGLPELGAPPLALFDPTLPEVADEADDYLFDRVLDPFLADYLVRGGFPEALFEPDAAACRRSLRDEVVARAIHQDLPNVVGIQRPAEVERVLLGALLQEGAPLQIESFAEELALDSGTIGRYLEHLERAWLLTSLRNFAASTERSRPRIHALDPALPNALLERGTALLARPAERLSLLVGTVVAHVGRVARAHGWDLAYFREGDLEAELVVVRPEGALPVLVSDHEELGEEERVRLQRVLKKTGASRAWLLSRARPRRRAALNFFEQAFHVPVAYFLYALR